MGLLFSLAAFVVTLVRARVGLASGLESLLAVGYAYGIVRANFPDGRSHFAFDAALLGLYLGYFSRQREVRAKDQTRPATFWLKALLALPFLYFLIPIQHPLIQLVGLRSLVLFIPLLLLGARLELEDLARLARTVAVLNAVAVAFGLAEIVWGVERFYPRNTVTSLIFKSTDVGADRALRIPATFSSAHAFGGTLAGTLPLLLGSWSHLSRGLRERMFLLVATGVTTFGVFMSGARQPVVLALVLLAAAAFSSTLSLRRKVALAMGAALVTLLVSSSERFQRFLTLRDTAFVEERVQGSVNLEFLDIIWDHPVGVGLGRAAGTSIPFFLEDLAEPPIGIENEFARIALEIGLPGLIIWVAFIFWSLSRRLGWVPPGWRLALRLVWLFVALTWATALIGTGTLISIPGTSFLLLYTGLLISARGTLPVSSHLAGTMRPLRVDG